MSNPYIDKFFNLKDKVIAITGGAGHLCSKMALGFNHAGCSVAILDSNIKKAETLAIKISDAEKKVIALQIDVSKKQDLKIV